MDLGDRPHRRAGLRKAVFRVDGDRWEPPVDEVLPERKGRRKDYSKILSAGSDLAVADPDAPRSPGNTKSTNDVMIGATARVMSK